MYLKSLELHGFKSFPNRTVLKFEPGATVVVGPNGSGKSNISDAMRWVLGEISSKNIRGTKMEDVIFGGTDDRRPMGFAEVSVTFDNSDKEHGVDSPYDEITVTRRYYRSGDSEYQINRKPVRLKDIHELFMNTGIGREGYSIIGQGKIAEILSKKSEDRRNIFEEAAGISKYRYRKEEAERKLGGTEENMTRIRDILGELEGRVGPLEHEAEKARKYLELYNQKKQADVSLWLYDTERLRSELKEAEDAFTLASHELEVIEEAVSSLESQNDRLFQQSQANKLISEQLLSQIRSITEELHQYDSNTSVAQNSRAHCDELIEQCNTRIAEIDQSMELLTGDREKNRGKIDALQNTVDDLTAKHIAVLQNVTDAQNESHHVANILEDKLSKIKELEEHAVDLRVRIDVLKNAVTADVGKKESLDEEIKKYESAGTLLAEEAARCEKSVAGFKEKIGSAENTIASGNTRLEELLATRQKELDHVGELSVSRNTLLQQAETLSRMEEHFEGYANSVRFIMTEYAQGSIRGCGEILGPLSKLISTNPKFITAIETALGANLQNVVVDTEECAKAAIEHLKQNKAGRATFYPISAIRASGESEETSRAAGMNGYEGRADSLLKHDQRIDEIVRWLLGKTVVFDNIDNASRAAKSLRYKIRIVTLDGQIINAGGSYTGGSVKRDSGILSRASEIESFRKQAAFVGGQIEKINDKIAKITKDIETEQQNVKEAEQQKELLLTMSRVQFAAHDNAQAKLEANKNLLEKIRADYQAIDREGTRCNDDISRMTKEAAKLDREIEELNASRAEDENTRNEWEDKIAALKSEANELYIRIAGVKKDIESAEQMGAMSESRIAELTEKRSAMNEQIRQHREKAVSLEAQVDEFRTKSTELEAKLSSLNDERARVESGTTEFESRLSELRTKIREKSNHKDLCFASKTTSEAKLNQLKAEQDRLGSRLWDDYELSYEQALAMDCPQVTKENRSSFAAIQNSCRSKIRALGSVNVSAIEEYSAVRERYDALSKQVNDLTKSRDELTGIIDKLESEMKTAFMDTFNAINKNFSIVFSELFGGGQAELSLTDPDDVLTSGIEIKAAPPGKIIKSLSLLSGGEQAFVAIALFFSVLKANPIPFCILDEIEAALDEVNVFRFGDYVKKYSDSTQFIIITHRRGTMDVADRLYGVTMPERGVSRVLPVDMKDLDAMKKELEADGVH